MRFRRRIETVTARSTPDPFFIGRLAIVDVRSDAELACPDVASVDGCMGAWIAAELPTAHCRPPHTDRRTA